VAVSLQLRPLLDVQTLDLRLTELRSRQAKIPEQIAAAERQVEERVNVLQEVSAAAEVLTKDRRNWERDLETQETQISKMRNRLMELKTNKEYQAHLFEIEMANKKKGEVEDQVLTIMERLDAKQKEMQEAKQKLAEAEQVFANEKTTLEVAAKALADEIQEVDSKFIQARGAVDPRLYERYQKIRVMRKGVAIATIKNGSCSGCRLHLPPQLVAEVKRSDEVMVCSHCHRLLYWEGDVASLPLEVSP
jgi:predicted  nucleic acid-binding Zn-ribbon protein